MSSAVIFFLGFFSASSFSSSAPSFSSAVLYRKSQLQIHENDGGEYPYFSNNLRADLIFLFCFWVSSFLAFFNAAFMSLRAWYYDTGLALMIK